MCQSKAQGGRRCPSCQTRYPKKAILKIEKQLKIPQTEHREDILRQHLFNHYSKIDSVNEEVELRNHTQEISKYAQQPDGGATFNSKKKTLIKRGFAYSPYPEYSKAIPADKLTDKDISDYLEEHNEILAQDGHNLGVWHDPETGIVYLDISVVSTNIKQARKECKEKDQLAFFDMQTFSSVVVDRNATSGQLKT